MRISFSPFALLATSLFLTSAAAHADYVWLERDTTGAAHAYVGEFEAAKGAPGTITGARAFMADGKDLPLSVEAERLNIAAPASGDLRLAATRSSDKGVLNYFQAKNGRSETKAVNDLELVPTEANGNTFKLVWKGNTVAASQVNVETSEGWRRVLKPAKDGTVTLTTPFPARYLLEVSARVNGSVTLDGKKYDDVRHTATLTFEVKK
ncbi:hypothetical protein ACFQPC_13220 [Herminiimonas glaciei]|uniref:DUF4198 domain-containing protein n=1 Tax=Herminiimonas glaciei TaxID=523788 RepID=A0ABW2ID77_9BURK